MAIGTPYSLGSIATTGGVSTKVLTVAANAPVGDLVVSVLGTDGAISNPSVVDSKGNSWTVIQLVGSECALAWAICAAGKNLVSGTDTITWSWTTAHAATVLAGGCNSTVGWQAAPVDKTASNTGTGATLATGTTAATTQAVELAIVAWSWVVNTAGTLSNGTYTTLVHADNASTDLQTALDYKVLSATGTQSASLDNSGSLVAGSAQIATFLEVSATTPSVSDTGGVAETLTVALVRSDSGTAAEGAVIIRPVNYETNLLIQKTATQLRNDVIASGGKTFLSASDTFTADGTAFQWPLSYSPSFSAPTLPTLLVNGALRTIGQASGTGAPSTAYAVLSLSPGYALLVTGSDGLPPSGTILALSYQWELEALARLQDAASITAAAALPNQGIFTFVISSGVQAGLSGAVGVCRSQLTGYSQPLMLVTATIGEEYRGTPPQKGQSITLTSNRLGVSQSFVIASCELMGSAAGVGRVFRLQLQS